MMILQHTRLTSFHSIIKCQIPYTVHALCFILHQSLFNSWGCNTKPLTQSESQLKMVDKYCPNHYTMLLSCNTIQSVHLNTPDIQPGCCKTAVSMHKLTTIPDDTHPLVSIKTEFRAPEYRIIQHEPTFMPYCNRT